MSYSQSGRPETSIPETSSSASDTDVDETKLTSTSNPGTGKHDDEDLFVPHVFDFIYLAGEVANRVQAPIPAMFLEAQAVDSSVLIGHGASFSALTITAVEEETVEIPNTTHEGLMITIEKPAQPAKPIVYKTARIAFTSTGEPVARDRRAMSSAMMEIYALMHPPLRKHENIIKLLGLAWGSNPYDPSHRLPVLVVEYADLGTLDDLQQTSLLTSVEKRRLCLDVALGLEALHGSGLVHGDVKAENVLMFTNKERKYIAKVADFGFSVVEAAASTTTYIGGTRPWRAPEATEPIARSQLKQTDIYSFGLLVWRVATDGQNPFTFVLPRTSTVDEFSAHIESSKQNDELKINARTEAWFPSYYVQATKAKGLVPLPAAEILAKSRAYTQHMLTMQQGNQKMPRTDVEAMMDEIVVSLSAQGIDLTSWNDVFVQKVQTDPFYACIDQVVEHSLGKDPSSRSLSAVVDAIKLESESRPRYGPNDILRRSFDHHFLSWELMRRLQPSIQTWIFDTFEANRLAAWKENKINPPQYFILASSLINGYGTPIDFLEAKRLINLAAINGHEPSEAYAYRIWSALTPDSMTTKSFENHLEAMAIKGSRMAWQDLKLIAPGRADWVRNKLKEACAGVGADFFFKHNMLHGLAHWPWQDMLQSRATIAEKLVNVKDKTAFRVNKRGDRIIHIAAASGWEEAVEALIDSYSVDVNLKNDCNETPLLSACRAGHAHVARRLVDLGADAAISTSANESPLHWLVSFEGELAQEMGNFLIGAGADVLLETTENISYSTFKAGIEVDYQKPGSPLAWAVHHNRPDIVKFFLSAAPNATICTDKSLGGSSPLEWSAHFHHHECLKLMLDALNEAKIRFAYGSLVSRTIASADTFSMILRHGHAYQENLHCTLDIYVEHCRNITFLGGIVGGSFAYSPLHLAITYLSDPVVSYLLSPSVAAHTSPNPQYGIFHPTHINLPAGPNKRTPLLESVRLDRPHISSLLLSHGADKLATSLNPYFPTKQNWTALHTFAHAAHNSPSPSSLLDLLLSPPSSIPIEGRVSTATEPETPFSIALGCCALNLASHLLARGADVDALSANSGLISAPHPMTALGYAAAGTSHSALFRLRGLLAMVDLEKSFVVEPAGGLTALHRAAMAYMGMGFLDLKGKGSRELGWEEVDWATNRAVVAEVLSSCKGMEGKGRRVARCKRGRTALHWAVEAGNVGAVEELLEGEGGAVWKFEDGDEHTVLALAEKLVGMGGKKQQRARREILMLLKALIP